MDADRLSDALGLHQGIRLLDRHELEREIARGGMGSVWRATHLGLQSAVAVKFATGAGEMSSARLFAEARTAAGLGSPHIVRVFDIGSENGVPFLVMELLEGESLEERLLAQGSYPSKKLSPWWKT